VKHQTFLGAKNEKLLPRLAEISWQRLECGLQQTRGMPLMSQLQMKDYCPITVCVVPRSKVFTIVPVQCSKAYFILSAARIGCTGETFVLSFRSCFWRGRGVEAHQASVGQS